MNRRILQVILAVIGLIAIITGLLGIISGAADDFYGVSISRTILGNVILDSNLRYYSGLWLGLGLILFFIVPSIERQKTILRLVSCMVFIGAIGRIVSIIMVGVPSTPFIVFTGLELFFPLLILWQNRIGMHQHQILSSP